MMNVRGVPLAASGPTAGIVSSLRTRPWASRKRLVCTVREMVVPSESVCLLSAVAAALNGAPVTTLPCIPPIPRSSMRSLNGPGPNPGPRIAPCPGGGGAESEDGSWANETVDSSSAALATKIICELNFAAKRFMHTPPLLSFQIPVADCVRYSWHCRRNLRILMKPYRLRLSVFANQKIHADKFRRPIRVDRQPETFQRAPLHANFQN